MCVGEVSSRIKRHDAYNYEYKTKLDKPYEAFKNKQRIPLL